MKKFLIIGSFAIFNFFSAQNVVLNKVAKVSDNKDKILYKINPSITQCEYLGELEVQGYSNNEEYVFGLIYKKAKEIGANAFSFLPFESVDGKSREIDLSSYKLNLYYVTKNDFPKEDNIVYILNTSEGSRKISFNNAKIDLPSYSYIKRDLKDNAVSTLSTRQFLGSSVKLSSRADQGVQYFQVTGAKVRANPYGSAGINLKTGDIILLERSYAEFLTTIYIELR